MSAELKVETLYPPDSAQRISNYVKDQSARKAFSYDIQLERFPNFLALQPDVKDQRRMQCPESKSAELLKPRSEFSQPKHMCWRWWYD